MFSDKKIETQSAIQTLMEEAGDFTESGYLLTDEYLERLARSIYTASRLPENDNYVKIIGHGYEKSNQEAVYTLVMNNLDSLREVYGIHHLEKGLELIEQRFLSVEQFFSA